METNVPGGGTRKVISDSSVLADGSPQTILSRTAVKMEDVFGWINLNNMDFGDRLTITTTVNNQDGEGDVSHAVESYEDGQVESSVYLVHHTLKPGATIIVVLQQTAGVNRTYPYVFMRAM
jgi:hypothetical protein